MTDTEKTPQSMPKAVTEIANSVGWHKTSHLADGTPIGRLGAYWYILDEDSRAVSDGYHEIYCDENGDYKGKRSTQTEEIVLSSRADRAESNHFDERRQF